MFKNLKLSRKMAVGFGTIVLLIVTLGVLNYAGLNRINSLTMKSQEVYANQTFAIEKEVDHFRWMSGVSDLFLNPEVTQLAVQTDDHKCGLGQWLYSE